MNILRKNFLMIIRQRNVLSKLETLGTAVSLSRYKSDTSDSQSRSVSLNDLKDLSNANPAKHQSLSKRREDGLALRILKKIPFLKVDELRVKHAGYLLYEDFADRLNYSAFFEEFALPDTFYSWFVLNELHIWILSTRAMAEEDIGNTLRNSIIECFWTDVAQRMKYLGVMGRDSRLQLWELSEQLQASFLGYDEGLQSDDIVLAGAIWRRVYKMEQAHPEHLEKLVKYIRKQLVLLDNTSRDNLLQDKHVNWDFSI